jgi:Leucine-rich repeat (LRR) protein
MELNSYLNLINSNEEMIDLSYHENDEHKKIKINITPNFSRFINLKTLYCYKNNITKISGLEMPNLKKLSCSNNKIVSLTDFPNLEELLCSNNQLTRLPNMPKIRVIYCLNNKLTSITPLPKLQNLTYLYCTNNKIKYLPKMPQILAIYCYNNELKNLPDISNIKYINVNNNHLINNFGIVESGNEFDVYSSTYRCILIKNNRIFNRFRELYFCFKFKKQLMYWLWELVRKNKIEQIYHPSNLNRMFKNNDEWEETYDEILDKW